jgi:hypothetical protein
VAPIPYVLIHAKDTHVNVLMVTLVTATSAVTRTSVTNTTPAQLTLTVLIHVSPMTAFAMTVTT